MLHLWKSKLDKHSIFLPSQKEQNQGWAVTEFENNMAAALNLSKLLVPRFVRSNFDGCDQRLAPRRSHQTPLLGE
jgi:hypothetical protein